MVCNIETLKQICKESYSIAEVLRKLELRENRKL